MDHPDYYHYYDDLWDNLGETAPIAELDLFLMIDDLSEVAYNFYSISISKNQKKGVKPPQKLYLPIPINKFPFFNRKDATENDFYALWEKKFTESILKEKWEFKDWLLNYLENILYPRIDQNPKLKHDFPKPYYLGIKFIKWLKEGTAIS